MNHIYSDLKAVLVKDLLPPVPLHVSFKKQKGPYKVENFGAKPKPFETFEATVHSGWETARLEAEVDIATTASSDAAKHVKAMETSKREVILDIARAKAEEHNINTKAKSLVTTLMQVS